MRPVEESFVVLGPLSSGSVADVDDRNEGASLELIVSHFDY